MYRENIIYLQLFNMFRLTSLFFLSFILLSVTAQWTDSSWTDSEFGGQFNLCFDGSVVNGAYSEYGIVYGELSSDEMTISGNFYDAGAGQFSCVTGSFELDIATDGNSFSGVYVCEDDGTSHDWSETLVGGSSSVSSYSCAVLSSSSIAGSYYEGESYTSNNTTYYTYEADVCVDSSEYYLSYTYDNVEGYENGVSYRNGAIGSGLYQNEDGTYGISLFFRLANGELGNFYWEVDNGEIDTISDYDTSLHGYDVITKSGDASTTECEVNNSLAIYYFDAQVIAYESSSASTISVLMVLSSFVLFFAC